MTLPPAATMRSVTATSRSNLDSQLNQAVQSLLESALEQRCGMVVTRKSPDAFTVRLGQSVPFGSIQEQDDWNQSER